VLVCPELRQAAITALPEHDERVLVPRATRFVAPEYRLLLSACGEPEEQDAHPAPLAVAVLTYTLQRAVGVAIEAVAVVGIVIGALALIATVSS